MKLGDVKSFQKKSNERTRNDREIPVMLLNEFQCYINEFQCLK